MSLIVVGCSQCQTQLQVPSGTQLVSCPTCGAVTSLAAGGPEKGGMGGNATMTEKPSMVPQGEEPQGAILKNDMAAPKYNDWKFTVAYIIMFVVFLIVMGVGWGRMDTAAKNNGAAAPAPAPAPPASTGGTTGTTGQAATPAPTPSPAANNLIGNFVGSCILTLIAGIFISLAWLLVLKKFPKQMIWISIIGCACLWFLGGLIFFIYGVAVAGVVMIICGLLVLLVLYIVRKRIPFAAIMLETTVGILFKYPSMIGVSFTSLLVGLVKLIIFVIGFVGIILGYQDVAGAQYIFMVYGILMFHWSTQTVRNIVHVTCSGTYATHYFLFGSGQAIVNPTARSLKRSVTYSLGSIFFGSLIVAVLETIRGMLRSISNQRSGLCALFACCAACMLGVIEDIIKYFNKYAYCQVAIFGKDFCTAAKDTFNLFKTKGMDMVINDDLTGFAMFVTALLSGLFTGLVGAAFGAAFFGTGTGTGIWIFLVALIGFFIGLVECTIMMTPVYSGVATIFVCFAESPGTLQNNMPSLFQAFNTAYAQRLETLFGFKV